MLNADECKCAREKLKQLVQLTCPYIWHKSPADRLELPEENRCLMH